MIQKEMSQINQCGKTFWQATIKDITHTHAHA